MRGTKEFRCFGGVKKAEGIEKVIEGAACRRKKKERRKAVEFNTSNGVENE